MSIRDTATYQRIVMRLPFYDRTLNAYWNARRRLWYALDCPPTIRQGLIAAWHDVRGREVPS